MSEPPDGRADLETGAMSGMAASPPPALAKGERVLSRYRILGLLARGGMGDVYEADDSELGIHVALKTIHPKIASDRAIERFKREIRLSRQITHPNVCRVFDLGRHGNIYFLTMELLAGETLSDRLDRAGPMTGEDALLLVAQMAAGLDAAHAAGVVHRDFKPGNVLLVPGTSGLRAVVTDFGLARDDTPSSQAGAAALTHTEEMIGTPAYMAPEQVSGRATTAATDIYALGLVMYRMVTGQLPFAGDTPLSLAVARLSGAASSPRAKVADLDPRWEAAILRCLERDPRERFSRAADVLTALSGGRAPASPRQRARMRAAWGFGIAACLVVGGSALFLLRPTPGPSPPPPLPAAVKQRRSVAVLGFKNLAGRGDLDWLSAAFSEMLATELAGGGRLRAVSGEEVSRARVDLALPQADMLAKDTLGRIRERLGTDLVVLGSYMALGRTAGGRLRLDVRVQAADTGETVASVAESGTEAELIEMVARTGERLREALGTRPLSEAEAGSLRAALPATPEVARLYGEGLARLRSFDALGGRDLLRRAAGADPKNPRVREALSRAWARLGYDAQAAEEARAGFELARALPREERLLVEARYYEASGEWDRAIALHRSLFGFFSDNLEYGLNLAEAEIEGGQAKEALLTIEALRSLAKKDPRLDLLEASAAEALSDHRRQLRASQRAAASSRSGGARLAVARAKLSEAGALLKLGEMPAAIEAAEAARDEFQAAGDRLGAATALNALANAIGSEGRNDEAQRLYEQAFAIHVEIGNKRGAAASQNNIAVIAWTNGDLAQARRLLERVAATFRELGDKGRTAGALNNLGLVLADQGDIDAAHRAYVQSLALAREIGNQGAIARALNNIGNGLREKGDLAAARASYEETLGIQRETGNKARVAGALGNIGTVLHAAGDLAGARAHFAEALAVATAIGDKSERALALSGEAEIEAAEGEFMAARALHEEALALRREASEGLYAAESQLALALLDLDEGRTEEAAKGAAEAASRFREDKARALEAAATDALARARLASGQLALARAALARAASLAAGTKNEAVRDRIAITTARIAAAGGQRTGAMRQLEALAASLTKRGLVALAFEARLASGEIQSAAGGGRSALGALAGEAEARGFKGIARRARAAP